MGITTRTFGQIMAARRAARARAAAFERDGRVAQLAKRLAAMPHGREAAWFLGWLRWWLRIVAEHRAAAAGLEVDRVAAEQVREDEHPGQERHASQLGNLAVLGGEVDDAPEGHEEQRRGDGDHEPESTP
jgi:hypothetical protein